MNKASWLLFGLSIVVLLLGAVSRFTPNGIVTGVSAGTYWKASMALLAYAVTVPIEVQCSARWEVLEAFVYIVQNKAQAENAPIPVDCGMSSPRRYNVEVSAGPEAFEQGEATATAYVLLQDPQGGGTTA